MQVVKAIKLFSFVVADEEALQVRALVNPLQPNVIKLITTVIYEFS